MNEPRRLRFRDGELPQRSLRARLLAAGLGTGIHRAERRGSGIEFAGHRPYVIGDDLRHLDRHALLRHGRHLIREFHTETERALHLVIDASPSMLYQSEGAPESKRGAALLLGAGLLLLARRVKDPVGLTILGTSRLQAIPARSNLDHFERLFELLEAEDRRESAEPIDWSHAIDTIAHLARRGTHVVVLSDLLEERVDLATELTRLCTQKRTLTVAQVLDPFEVDFPFQGPLRLQDPESPLTVDADSSKVREGYLRALETHTETLRVKLEERGSSFSRVLTHARLQDALRLLVESTERSSR